MTAASTPLTIEHVAIDVLRPDPANPRRIGDAELEALTQGIRMFGLVVPIVACRDGLVVAGHQRLVAARRLGLTFVPVVWVDLPLEQARVLGLALNKISGTWDEQLLARLMAELQAAPTVDLAFTGFSDDEVRDVLRTMESRERRDRLETFDLDAELEAATRSPRTEPGDLWALEGHRLLCGDATKAEDARRVLGGKRAAMTFTDPPYNVNMGEHGGHQRGSRRRGMANDALSPEAWEAFCRGWAGTILEATDGAVYVAMSSKEWPTVARILAEAGGHWSDTIIWNKDRHVLGRADYQRQYEPIWYGWREGAKRHWCGDRDQTDVWEIDRPSDAPLHAVMKPLALMERAIANSSRRGDLVFEPFAGSGSTLVACERIGRTCAAIELDPVFVEVILRRWERFTGSTAVRIDD
jgi:DNA modification methylase